MKYTYTIEIGDGKGDWWPENDEATGTEESDMSADGVAQVVLDVRLDDLASESEKYGTPMRVVVWEGERGEETADAIAYGTVSDRRPEDAPPPPQEFRYTCEGRIGRKRQWRCTYPPVWQVQRIKGAVRAAACGHHLHQVVEMHTTPENGCIVVHLSSAPQD